MILEQENHVVKHLPDCDLMSPCIQFFSPDIIFMDILVGQNDGRVLCNMLKEDKLTKDIPVVLITAMLETQAR